VARPDVPTPVPTATGGRGAAHAVGGSATCRYVSVFPLRAHRYNHDDRALGCALACVWAVASPRLSVEREVPASPARFMCSSRPRCGSPPNPSGFSPIGALGVGADRRRQIREVCERRRVSSSRREISDSYGPGAGWPAYRRGMGEPILCMWCGDVIGVYEAMVVVEDGSARVSSRALEPHPAGDCFHSVCHALVWPHRHRRLTR
jgi:hypothetical protein